jgi:hypothetical protein
MDPKHVTPPSDLDVLVVGAGPTGLTLAGQLACFNVRFRIIDKARDRAHESRALAVQARSLEVLQSLGVGQTLASGGRTTTRLLLHVDRHEPVAIDLGDIGRSDTRFPYILFVSQSDTETVLIEHLASKGVSIERSVDLVSSNRNKIPVSVSCGILTVARNRSARRISSAATERTAPFGRVEAFHSKEEPIHRNSLLGTLRRMGSCPSTQSTRSGRDEASRCSSRSARQQLGESWRWSEPVCPIAQSATTTR